MQRFGSDWMKSGHGRSPLKMTLMTQIGLRLCIAAIDTVWICVTGAAFASYDDAANFALSKARQIIDLQGDRIFG